MDLSHRTSARCGAVNDGRVEVRGKERLGLLPSGDGPLRVFPLSVLFFCGGRRASGLAETGVGLCMR